MFKFLDRIIEKRIDNHVQTKINVVSNENDKAINVKLPENLHTELKTRAFSQGKLLKEYIIEILLKSIDKSNEKAYKGESTTDSTDEKRATFIVNKDKLDILKNIAHIERLQLKQVIDFAIGDFIKHYDGWTKSEIITKKEPIYKVHANKLYEIMKTNSNAFKSMAGYWKKKGFDYTECILDDNYFDFEKFTDMFYAYRLTIEYPSHTTLNRVKNLYSYLNACKRNDNQYSYATH